MRGAASRTADTSSAMHLAIYNYSAAGRTGTTSSAGHLAIYTYKHVGRARRPHPGCVRAPGRVRHHDLRPDWHYGVPALPGHA